MALSTVSKRVYFDELIQPYLEELHDRNVFLAIKDKPQFDELTEAETNENFFHQVYRSCRAGFDLLMFFNYFNHYAIQKDSNVRHFDDLVEEYDKRYSRLYHKIEDALQAKIKQIINIHSYRDLYQELGINQPTMEELNRI
jgi:hypothetical protein